MAALVDCRCGGFIRLAPGFYLIVIYSVNSFINCNCYNNCLL